MKPSKSVTIARAWHWGLAILDDPAADADYVDVDVETIVTAAPDAVLVQVRHAQDLDPAEDVDDLASFPQATLYVRRFDDPPTSAPRRAVVHEGELATSSGQLGIGDADGVDIIGGLDARTMVRISVNDPGDLNASEVWIDLWGVFD